MLVALKSKDAAVAVDHTQIKRIVKFKHVLIGYTSEKYRVYYSDDSDTLSPHIDVTKDNYLELVAILDKLSVKSPSMNTKVGETMTVLEITYDWDNNKSVNIDLATIYTAIPQLKGKEYQVKNYYLEKLQKYVVEVDTPFTDAISDGIGVYILKEDNNTYKITDDGWTYYNLKTYNNVTTKKLAENQLIDIPDNEDIKLYNDGDEIVATCDKDGLQEAFNLVLTTIIRISIQAVEQSKKLD